MLPGKHINSVPSGRETQDPLLKSRAVPQCRVPECGDVPIQLRHEASLHQTFHHRGQGNDSAPGERLDKEPRCRSDFLEPNPNVRDEPRLPAGIAQRAALRHGCDVYRRNRRDLYAGAPGVPSCALAGHGVWFGRVNQIECPITMGITWTTPLISIVSCPLLTDTLLDEPDDELFLGVRTLHGVSGPAEQLKVVDVIAPAFGARDDMVDGEVAERE